MIFIYGVETRRGGDVLVLTLPGATLWLTPALHWRGGWDRALPGQPDPQRPVPERGYCRCCWQPETCLMERMEGEESGGPRLHDRYPTRWMPTQLCLQQDNRRQNIKQFFLELLPFAEERELSDLTWLSVVLSINPVRELCEQTVHLHCFQGCHWSLRAVGGQTCHGAAPRSAPRSAETSLWSLQGTHPGDPPLNVCCSFK